ncbi:MAG: hypothetical protein HY762_04250 [Planctomycetes bacterium]|nr:hypothetical protein [Planctomycetota bacterium]
MIVFNCNICVKKLQVKDELAGRKVKCPGCNQVVVVPEPEIKLEIDAADKSAVKSAEAGKKRCPTCATELYEGDAVCLKCGTVIKQVAGRREAKAIPFYKNTLFYIAVIAVIALATGVYYYLNTRPESTEPPNDNKHSAVGNKPDNQTPPPPPSAKPEELLRQEIKNGDIAKLDGLVKGIIAAGSKSIDVIAAEIKNPAATVKTKSAYALYLLTYYNIYRQNIFPILDGSARSRDDNLRLLILEMTYMALTDERDDGLLSLSDAVKPYGSQFKDMEKSPPDQRARTLLNWLSGDTNNLIRAKAIIYLLELGGDKSNVKQLINLLKEASAEPIIKRFLKSYTGQPFEKIDEWDNWWKDNRALTRAQWLAGALDKTADPQRLTIIRQLAKLRKLSSEDLSKPGQQFIYSESDTDEFKQSVIKQWQDWARTQK